MTAEPVEGEDKQGKRFVITSDGSPFADQLIELLRESVRKHGEGGGLDGAPVR